MHTINYKCVQEHFAAWYLDSQVCEREGTCVITGPNGTKSSSLNLSSPSIPAPDFPPSRKTHIHPSTYWNTHSLTISIYKRGPPPKDGFQTSEITVWNLVELGLCGRAQKSRKGFVGMLDKLCLNWRDWKTEREWDNKIKVNFLQLQNVGQNAFDWKFHIDLNRNRGGVEGVDEWRKPSSI